MVGGDRVIAATDDLNLQAQVLDPLDQPSTASDPLILITWTCNKIVTGTPCTDASSNLLTLPANQLTQTIPALSFSEWTSYVINVTASKGTRTNTFSMKVTVTDHTIPPLELLYPITIHSRYLLINEVLNFSILVPQSRRLLQQSSTNETDSFTYSLIVIYQNSPQAV